MPEYIQINGTRVAVGQKKLIEVSIATLPSRMPIDISVYVHRAKVEGPVVLLLAGMHGDEVNGTEIIRRLLKDKRLKLQKGSIIAIPILNIYGFLNFARELPDGKDVNRSFPGTKNGSLASRMAFFVTHELIPQIDYGIDFHTGGRSIANYPQIRCLLDNPVNEELARKFAPGFILDAPFRDKSLRKEAAKYGKPIIVYEGGESMRFDEYSIREGINGTIRVLHHLGMIKAFVQPMHDPLVLKYGKWMRARDAGFFHPAVAYGDMIRKNQVIGKLTDPDGMDEEELRAVADGYVVGVNHMPVVYQGDALLHIGTQE